MVDGLVVAEAVVAEAVVVDGPVVAEAVVPAEVVPAVVFPAVDDRGAVVLDIVGPYGFVVPVDVGVEDGVVILGDVVAAALDKLPP